MARSTVGSLIVGALMALGISASYASPADDGYYTSGIGTDYIVLIYVELPKLAAIAHNENVAPAHSPHLTQHVGRGAPKTFSFSSNVLVMGNSTVPSIIRRSGHVEVGWHCRAA